jgi:AhpD family alkylhydroperoxidase
VKEQALLLRNHHITKPHHSQGSETMEQRLDFYKASPEAIKALVALEVAIGKRGLDPMLVNLVRLRASQINGCAYCVDSHSSDARKAGETERRVYAVAAWRESPLFTDRERAALAWTESLTLLPETHAPDADFAGLHQQFSETEMVDLSLVIGAINIWNRFGVGFRKIPAA